MNNRILLSFFSVFIFVSGASATPASDSSLTALFQAMNLEKAVKETETQIMSESQRMIPSMVESQLSRMMNDPKFQNLSADSKKELGSIMIDFSGRVISIFQDEYGKKIPVAQFTRDSARELYKKYYTEEDIQELIKIYQSPVGKKLLEVTPKLIGDQSRIITQTIFPEISKLISEIVEQEGPKVVADMGEKAGQAKK